jgi:hypothetical protein
MNKVIAGNKNKGKKRPVSAWKKSKPLLRNLNAVLFKVSV